MDGDTLMPTTDEAKLQAIAAALTQGALPGETDGLGESARA